MGDFSKIGLGVALQNETMARWLRRMSQEGMEREPVRVEHVGELWGDGIESWQMATAFLSGTRIQALGGLFPDEGGIDLEERELRDALERRIQGVVAGLSFLRAMMREHERVAEGDLREKLGKIGDLMDSALPEGLRPVVVAGSEAALAEIGTPKPGKGKPRPGL